MNLRISLLLLLCVSCCSLLLAQGWEKEFVEEMWPYHMLETDDGGYLISGFYTIEEPGTFVTKIDQNGDQGWRLNFVEGGGIVLGGRMVRTADDNYVLRVRVKVEVVGVEYVKHKFVKFNSEGNILWEFILNETESEINFIGDFYAETDSSIVFPTRIGEDHFIGVLDVNGVLASLNPSPGLSFIPNFSQTPNGKYYYQGTASNGTVVIREVNQMGTQLSQNTYDSRATGELFYFDNKDLVIFESFPQFQGLRQLRVDSTNNLVDVDTLWQSSDIESGITTLLADGFLHTGTIKSTTNAPNSILVTKTDFDGNIIWQKNYDHRQRNQIGNRTYPTSDGGHLTVGIYFPGIATGNSIGPWQDAYLIKSSETGEIYSNIITGTVSIDENDNCQIDSFELPIEDWIITATKGNQTLVTTSKANGEYILPVDTGTYVLRLNLPNSYWAPCVNDTSLDFPTFNNTVSTDFEVQEVIDCPSMAVNGSIASLRPCMERPNYINYCNYGTTLAENAFIDIHYEESITPVASTLPWVSLPDNIYRFEIGNIEPLECGNFRVDLLLDCDASVGSTFCIEAFAFPDTICEPPAPGWSGAFLEVNGICDSGEIDFDIQNTGTGAMASYSDYIIVEDVILLRVDSVQLEPLEIRNEVLSANGSTYTIIVDQVTNAPGAPQTMAFIEGCGENDNGTFSIGFAHQFPYNDSEVYSDIDCPIAVNSFDPNDKQGFPIGYKLEHLIQPETPIEFLIRFQNTGTDTAYNVVVRDTLDTNFDVTSFQLGASSHAYDLEMEGEGILKFTFLDINLPDSIVDLEGSNGFLEFKLTPKKDIPLGTIVYNRAGIYFDLNEPIITNETYHQIGENYVQIISDVTEHPSNTNVSVKIYPNPFVDQAIIEIENHPFITYQFEVYTVDGKQVRNERHNSPNINFSRKDLVTGIYFYRIIGQDGFRHTGRMIVQ